ncbi:Putative anti-sigma factor antagonist BtrV [Caballeronia cordobensis]|uniref:Anti-sigma factor antagonist n=1 Tax=Caballeronia cordobensis TaxID=1353886 RepID=A0A158GW95_CABCO|nr:STAS domain-containing protein [Caballeronia cordobensis]SAL35750.1 Putative anti-sigma factor antagonist BtrV [Caballeronia cordobensis]
MANQYEVQGDVLVVSLEGALNSMNAAQVEAEVQRRLDQGTNQLLFDLGALGYISSAGLRVVLIAAKRLRQSAGRLVLCGMHDQIREAFEISGFLNILDVADTRACALERFNEVA